MSLSPITAVVRKRRRRNPAGFLDAAWTKVEIVGAHDSGRLILREIGKFWPGVPPIATRSGSPGRSSR